MDRRAGGRFLWQQHGDSLAQAFSGERRGERWQHSDAVFLADLPYRLDDDRLAGANDENLAAELPVHQGFENFASLDPIDRHAENDKVGELIFEDGIELVSLSAFAGYEAEIFKDIGEEQAEVFLAIRNASTRRNFSTPKG